MLVSRFIVSNSGGGEKLRAKLWPAKPKPAAAVVVLNNERTHVRCYNSLHPLELARASFVAVQDCAE
jgi:hypothetical protein